MGSFLKAIALVFVVVGGGWLGFVSSTVVVVPDSLVYGLYEFYNTEEIITDVDCIDDTRSDDPVFVVSVSSVIGSGCDGCFQVYPQANCGTSSDFCLKFYPQELMEYATTREYFVELECAEAGNDTNVSTQEVEVRLFPNTPPIFSTDSDTFTLSDTEDVAEGDSIYDVDCSDPDGDAVEFTLTTDHDDLFYIDTEGVIRAKVDLNVACFTSVSFEVECSDRINDAIDPVYIDMTLEDINEQPSITGLNFNLEVTEDKAIDTTLVTFTVNDDNTPDCYLYANPSASLQYFDLDTATKSIFVKKTLDYEITGTRLTNLTVICSDNYCTSSTYFLYVKVTEVNEEIVLYPQDFTLSIFEGDISIDPGWTPIDPDIDDDPIYTIVNGNANGYFAIDPDTGRITSTLTIDIDESLMPDTDTLVVQVTDEGGHTSTTTVYLIILDFNDNTPIFTTGQQVILIDDCDETLGTIIGTAVTATDRDSDLDGNNVLRYSSSGTPIAVDADGNLYVSGTVTAGSSYSVDITASDSGTGDGGTKTSVSVTVTLIVNSCVTTTAAPTTAAPTTSAAPFTTTTVEATTGANSEDSLDENLAWIIFAALLATVFLALLMFMVFAFCLPAGVCAAGALGGFGGRCSAFCNKACGKFCQPRHKPVNVQPVRGKAPPHGNPDFWRVRDPEDKDQAPLPVVAEREQPLGMGPTGEGGGWRAKHGGPGGYPDRGFF